MQLQETTKMMNSSDYKERFYAEYWQTKIRYDKLDAMTVKYEAGTLNFTPSCSLELLKEQKKHMGNYIRCLKIRAEIEGIDLIEPIRTCSNCKYAHRIDEITLRCDAEQYDTISLSCFVPKDDTNLQRKVNYYIIKKGLNILWQTNLKKKWLKSAFR